MIGNILPFYWRFMQCIRRYYDTKDFNPHILNALKYLSTIVAIYLGSRKTNLVDLDFYFWIVTAVFSSLYGYYWDIIMDWGLMKQKDRSQDNFLLRENVTYPSYFYYFMMVINLILRFTWLLTILPNSVLHTYFEDENLVIMIVCLLEVIRRFLWTVIRIEHEILNNSEHYRDVLELPHIMFI